MAKNPPDFELIRRIASVVGHELRNPLAVIGNSAYFVKAKVGAGADPKVAKHLGIIESEVARADRLLEEILSYSRPLELKRAKTSLNELVKDCAAGFSEKNGMKVKTTLCAGALEADVDPAALQGALERLLANAFEAAGAAGTVAVATSSGGKGAAISVSDTGPGVDPKVKETLFEPFVTTKPKNLGLGLAVALKAAAAHGGSLTLQDRPGGGAVLTLSLPAGKP